MITRDELMAAVIASPDDDIPRLVLADWFAERGDPRGELIHVGCVLAAGSLDDAQRAACERRYAELIAGPGTLWLTELKLKNEVVAFRRGMVEAVALQWERFPAVADRLFASTPLRALTTWDFGDNGLRQWGQMPWLGRLQDLHLRGVDPHQLRSLLAPSDLTNVRRLTIEGNHRGQLGLAGARLIASWPSFPKVIELALINAGLTDAAVATLGERMGQLSAVDFTINDCGLDSLRVVASHGARLTRLALGSNRIGNAGAQRLATAEGLSQLESLRLESAQLGDPGALAILSSPLLPRLRRLDFASNQLTDAGAVAIAAVEGRELASLDVSANRIGARGERALRARYGDRVRI